MAEKKRNLFIDLLRGVSMVAVISLHALANYLGNPFVLRLWDYQQFAVQVFVFCSAYVFFSFPPQLSVGSFCTYFIKRLWRLYQPFLIYLVLFFVAVFLLQPQTFQWKTVVAAAMLIGGIDINWLVLLFVQFIPLFVLMQVLYTRHRFWFAVYVVLVTAASIFLFFQPSPYPWKIIMWLPWSFMALYAMFYKVCEENISAKNASYLLFGAIFIITVCIEIITKGSFAIYTHKYPPSILLLSYGIMWIGIFEFLYRQGLFQRLRLVPALQFMSTNSYSLFFIHYLIIYIMNTTLRMHKLLPWWGYMLVLFPLAIGAQVGVNWVMRLAFRKGSV